MKRIVVILIVVLIVGSLCVIPCLADGGFYNILVNQNKSNYFNYNIDVYLLYSDSDVDSVYWGRRNNIYVSPGAEGRYCSFRFVNNYDYSVNIIMQSENVILSHTSIYIEPGKSVDIDCTLVDPGFHLYHLCIQTVNLDVDYSFSVFNANSLINIVGNVFGMIFNSSSILLPIFLIGITVSLGLVAVRFIRKVMWSR